MRLLEEMSSAYNVSLQEMVHVVYLQLLFLHRKHLFLHIVSRKPHNIVRCCPCLLIQLLWQSIELCQRNSPFQSEDVQHFLGFC